MFVFSLRANKPRLIIILCAVVVVLLVLIIALRGSGRPVVNSDMSFKASTPQERVAFLSQYGWKVNEEPAEVSEVIIPSEFGDTYEEYNSIQKDQGLDLMPYKGRRVKRWVYEIKNFPGYEENSGCIRATLLVYDGTVIGGDVSSLELDGFMQGFKYPSEQQNTSKAN